MVTAIDDVILQIKEALESNDMLDNSIIIFASDNGGLPGQGANNLPLRGGKNSWFEGGVKTPSFIYSPLFDGTLTTGSDNEWYVFCFRRKTLNVLNVANCIFSLRFSLTKPNGKVQVF